MADQKQKARELIELKQEHDEKRLAYEDAKRKHKAAEADFWHELDEDGVKTLTLELGDPYGTVQLQRRETIKGRIIDEEKAIAALKRLGLADGILKDTPQIRQKVLNEHVRDALKGDQDLPEGVDFFSTRYIQVSVKG